VLPAIVTPFKADGAIDWNELERYLEWLASVDGVTGLVVNGHAGEGTSLSERERGEVISATRAVVGGRMPVIASVFGDGSAVAAEDGRLAALAGADMLLVFPAANWLRFGYQSEAPRERYEAIGKSAGLPMILFQFPVITHASYSLDTILDICEVPAVVAIKDGGRDMIRWDTDVPIIRSAFPDVSILTCQDEFLLHTMWEADGALVGFGALVPELMSELLVAAQAHDYELAKQRYDRLTPLAKAVYHRSSHIESTPAMKLGLVQRGRLRNRYVRAPLVELGPDAETQIAYALSAAGITLAEGAAA
jgi:4-hydroxy-tetrahydrodipicolinate synthase